MTKEKELFWFPCYPTKLLGAFAGMKPTEGYVYWIVCLRYYECNGPCPDSLDALCRRTGYNKRVVSDALDKLFRSGKLRRDPGGIVNPFAERILGEQKSLHEGRVEAARKAGLKSAEKRKEKQPPDPTPGQPEGNVTPTKLKSELKLEIDKNKNPSAQSAEGGIHDQVDPPKPETPKRVRTKPKKLETDWPKDYQNEFWRLYPRRTEKTAANKILKRLAASGVVAWETFLAGLRLHADKVRLKPEEFIKHPTTWLNKGCWEDEYQPDLLVQGELKNGNHRKGRGGFGVIAAELDAVIDDARQDSHHPAGQR